ncbi:hypothetical protein JNJ66_02640 [Candidatus Saccharibacteria bacterium]|nr:hypothetical protein [Candidatus Saccharibacteria bacterium]
MEEIALSKIWLDIHHVPSTGEPVALRQYPIDSWHAHAQVMQMLTAGQATSRILTVTQQQVIIMFDLLLVRVDVPDYHSTPGTSQYRYTYKRIDGSAITTGGFAALLALVRSFSTLVPALNDPPEGRTAKTPDLAPLVVSVAPSSTVSPVPELELASVPEPAEASVPALVAPTDLAPGSTPARHSSRTRPAWPTYVRSCRRW